MNKLTTLENLRTLAEASVTESLHRIRQHPFIVEANAHRLSREQAERWIKCAGRESRSFPQILENLVTRCSNDQVKAILRDNLDDEYGNGNPDQAHFMHYLHLLDALEIPRSEFFEYEERAGISLALSLAFNVSMQPSEALAIGYMLVNEGMTQITYSAARNALQPYYPAFDTPFFALHVEVDEKHCEDLYRAVEELSSPDRDSLLFGILVGERGMAVLLDEAYGLFDHCSPTLTDEPPNGPTH